MTAPDRVLVRPRPNPAATWSLVCVPPAGAGVATFASWAPFLPADGELVGARLPGRETRLGEPAPASVAAAADELAAACARLDRPWVLLGHSMGALVAYETLRRLPPERQPRRLVVSGHNAPHRSAHDLRLHELTRAELVGALRELGGTPEEVLAHDELLDLVLPTLRADFGSVAGYTWADGEALTVPVSVLWASADPTVDAPGMRAWAELTTAPITWHEFAGGHFDLLEHPAELLAAALAGGVDDDSAGVTGSSPPTPTA